MSKLKISLDLDGVMFQTMDLWCERNNMLGNPHKTISDIKRWSFFEDFGMSVEDAFDIFHWCWRNWKRLTPMEADQDYKVARLSELGTVDIVTSIEKKFHPFVKRWLKEHGIEYNKIVFKLNKQDLDYDIYIDDSPINCVKMSRAKKLCLLYNQPWNYGLKGINIIRIYSLSQAYDVIKNKLIISAEYDLSEAR